MNQQSELAADDRLRVELRALLAGHNAHMTFEDAVAYFPVAAINQRPLNVPYTFWHLVEHLRLAQADILNFIVNADYKALEWPAEYWPAAGAEADAALWQASISAFLADRDALVAMLDNPQTDLTAELAHAPGYTVVRELMLAADHNAYHIGELGILRQVEGLWPAS